MATDNYAIAEQFSLLSRLMDIHGENSFKARAYAAAAFAIEKVPEPLQDLPREKISSIKGIGASAASKIFEILDTGSLKDLTQLIAHTPPGVLEMLQIKGLGPKKIATIWKEMGIESIGELLYACNENRLLLYKGFGAKTQDNLRTAIEFFLQHQGKFLYAEVDAVFADINKYLAANFGQQNVMATGAYRRQQLTLDTLEFVITLPNEAIKPRFQTAHPPELLEEDDQLLTYRLQNGLKLTLYTGAAAMGERLFHTTSPARFIEQVSKYIGHDLPAGTPSATEADYCKLAGIPDIPPYLRDLEDIDTSLKAKTPDLIQAKDIRGIIHSHSNWSDGAHTIEAMASHARSQGLEYLVISDHSKAAAYAGGLSEEKIVEQHYQIDELNRQLAPFRIFKSIECDILGDGSLDYADEILASFDLVIASVHSNLGMSEEKAMQRLLKAIGNPYTTILGHPTGRLLLSRSGYPIDHRKIIDACAAHHVAIELNAHPRRLDLDWEWIPYALEKKVWISIDPDAHAVEGFADCRYGVLAAQKGGLTAKNNLSSLPLAAFETYLTNRKTQKGI